MSNWAREAQLAKAVSRRRDESTMVVVVVAIGTKKDRNTAWH